MVMHEVCAVRSDADETLSAVEMLFKSDRLVVMYTPALDLGGKWWDQAMQGIRKTLYGSKTMSEVELEQLEEPAMVIEDPCTCARVEFFVMEYDTPTTWHIDAHYKTPPLSEQAERFLQVHGLAA